MDVLRVTVSVHNQIWDQFSVDRDHVLTSAFTGDTGGFDQVKSQLTAQRFKNNPLQQPDGINKQGNEQELLTKVSTLDISSHLEGCSSSLNAKRCNQNKYIPKLYINGYLLSLFVRALKLSKFYRKCVIAKFKGLVLKSGQLQVNIRLVPPRKDIIDYAWNKRLERMALERRELDHAMSWLSTLGGAFSALGEEFQHCAKMAGRISIHQFNLALRLGDPFTVARCKLYLALSLVQQGYLKRARCIIEQQYQVACAGPVVDTRLVSMCLGIWAKLKYEHYKKRNRKIKAVLR